MNTKQLACAIDIDSQIKKAVIGVYAADEINSIKLQRFGIIINTDPSYLPGQHWIVMFLNEHNVLEYFDSMANTQKLYLICYGNM